MSFFLVSKLRMRIKIFFLTVQLAHLFSAVYAESSGDKHVSAQAEASLRQLIKSVDYMRGDYPGAVGPGGVF